MPTRSPRICGCGRKVLSGSQCACERARAAERNARHDKRRPNAAARGYDSKWGRERVAYLAVNPRCSRCGAPATVVNHKVPHRGDRKLFWSRSNWEPVCKPCHDGPIQSEERRAYSIPHRLQRSGVPVHLICGAPGSGKSTYVRERATAGDLVIDMDTNRQTLGFHRHSDDPAHLKATFAERDRLIRALSLRRTGQAWLIVMAPTDDERRQWVATLGHVTVHAIETDRDECRRRIMLDPNREGQRERLLSAVDAYFAARDMGREEPETR